MLSLQATVWGFKKWTAPLWHLLAAAKRWQCFCSHLAQKSEHCSNFAFRPRSRENIMADHLPSATQHKFHPREKKISVGLISSRKKIDVINFMTRPWVLAQYMFNWNMEKRTAFTFIMYKPTHWSCDTDLTLNSTQDTDNAGRNNQDLSCFCFESQDQIY